LAPLQHHAPVQHPGDRPGLAPSTAACEGCPRRRERPSLFASRAWLQCEVHVARTSVAL
jgi:hypothetical protein